MTIEIFIEELRKSNPAINIHTITGMTIEGNFRGKKTTGFKFDFTNREFIFNNAGPIVEGAFKQILDAK